MSHKKNTHGELTFDFSQVSRRWGKAWYQLNRDESILTTQDVPEASELGEMTDEERERAKGFVKNTFATFDRVIEERDKLIAQVLVDVPRSWLVSDAPGNLDWSDPESLDWLVLDRYNEVVQAINNRRSAKN